MKTERQRQQELAISRGGALVFEYRCNDGEGFAAVASTESGAFCVLNAERPGIYAECLRSYAARPHDLRIYPGAPTKTTTPAAESKGGR